MSNLDDQDFQNYLESNDWTVECESPLEIRHKDGSFASQYAAKVLVEELYKQYQESSVDDDNDDVQLKTFEKLEKLVNQMDKYVETAKKVEEEYPPTEFDENRLSSTAYDVWKKTFSLVFSDHVSVKIRAYLSELGGELNYYSDYGYNDDVIAFHNAVKSEMNSLTKIFNPTNSTKMRM